MPQTRPRILCFAGSIRSESYNARLAALAAKVLALRDADVTLISLVDYPLPIYDADLERESGVPEPARQLRAQFVAHQGIFIASPEYNQSVTPLLKNTIDWISRTKPAPDAEASPWSGRVFALGAASPGYYGGIRSLMHLRQILTGGLGCTILPEQVSVPSAGSAFAQNGDLTNERSMGRLESLAGRLIEEAARHVLP